MKDEKGVRRVAEDLNWLPSLDLGTFGDILGWLGQRPVTLLVILLVLALVVWAVRRTRQRRDQIQKLWVFILFFLTKRQMMIPLVITLSEKDGVLDADLRKKLMDIRQQSRDVSFKKHPNQRLEIEEQVSKILFFYFSSLEKKGQIKAGTKFSKLTKDLEFIDAKLVQLQKVYNNEVTRWNKIVTIPVISLVCRVIGAAPFRAFK